MLRRDFCICGAALFGGATLLDGCSVDSSRQAAADTQDFKRKLRPRLEGDWWLIGAPPTPDEQLRAMPSRTEEEILAELDMHWAGWGMSPSLARKRARENAGKSPAFEAVDHHIFRGKDGNYHLWGCIRNTREGRVLYHWRASSPADTPWKQTGEIMRCEPQAGECIDDWMGQEWIQSPYIVAEGNQYYMFYGGHSTGVDKLGVKASGSSARMFESESQICLMTSDDGFKWRRYSDENGHSRVFAGPGEARDPCLLNIDGVWHCYYTGYEGGDPYVHGGIYVRTSEDLFHWSDYQLVHRHTMNGEHQWLFECPHVVYRSGYYYLFRTESYYDAKTQVYRSEDPLNFGVDDKSAAPLYVGELACAAPEIYQWEGKEYVSSNHDPGLGTQLSRLSWVDDQREGI